MAGHPVEFCTQLRFLLGDRRAVHHREWQHRGLDGSDNLIRHTFSLDKCCPQSRVAGDHVAQCVGQGKHIKRTIDPHRHRDVPDRTGPFEATGEPHREL